MIAITAADFKGYFGRGQFTYGTVLPAVLDADIDQAIADASAIFNFGLYPTDAIGNRALGFLSAHFLQTDLDSSDSHGQAEGIQSSRSANGISESVAVPPWMLEGEYAMYATTTYGRRWMLMTLQYLGGAVFSVGGGTQP